MPSSSRFCRCSTTCGTNCVLLNGPSSLGGRGVGTSHCWWNHVWWQCAAPLRRESSFFSRLLVKKRRCRSKNGADPMHPPSVRFFWSSARLGEPSFCLRNHGLDAGTACPWLNCRRTSTHGCKLGSSVAKSSNVGRASNSLSLLLSGNDGKLSPSSADGIFTSFPSRFRNKSGLRLPSFNRLPGHSSCLSAPS